MTSQLVEGGGLIWKWMTNKNTLEYVGKWEKINNPHFKSPEFGGFENQAGVNCFIMSVGHWIKKDKCYGLTCKSRKIWRYACTQGYCF